MGTGQAEPARPADGRWLVTLLGQRPQCASYVLGGREAPGKPPSAGAALFELLGGAGAFDRVVAVVTEEVRDSFALLGDFFRQRGVAAFEAVVGVQTDDFIRDFLGAFDSTAVGDIELTVDLTHGYRHFAVLGYVSLMYLAELRPGVSVRGCYYGKMGKDKDEDGRNRVEFLDLAPLVRAPDWLYATRSLRQRADAGPLAAMLEGAVAPSGSSKGARSARDGAKAFRDFADVLNWRCPVDMAEAAAELTQQGKNLRAAFGLAGTPLPEELGGQVARLVERYNAGSGVLAGRVNKSKPALSGQLLRQHAQAVSDAFERGEVPVAAGLLREWMVSWAYQELVRTGRLAGPDLAKRWLERDLRHQAESRLGSLAAMAEDKELSALLSEGQKQAGAFWREVCQLRNSFMHYGMSKQWALQGASREAVSAVKERWEKTFKSAPEVDLQVAQRHKCLLVSPLGKSPGVLVSALARCDPPPDAVMCIVSEETKGDAGRTCQEAGYASADVSFLTFRDARSGAPELEGLVGQARKELAVAGCVRVNLTGGTTLMGLLAQRAIQAARDLWVPVRSFVLLEPPVGSGEPAGEMVWVEPVSQEREEAGADER